VGHHRLRVLVAVALAGFVSAWLAYVHVYVPSGGQPIRWQTTGIGRLQLPRAETEVFHSRDEWLRYLGELDVAVGAPYVDFARDDAVLLALGPRSSTGSWIEVVSVEEQRGRVLLVARERYTRGRPAIVTYPSRLVLLRATGKPIAVDWR
jgi:hypothetical protein